MFLLSWRHCAPVTWFCRLRWFWCCSCTAAAVEVARASRSTSLFGLGAAVDIGVASCICDVCDSTCTVTGGIVLCILSAGCGAISCHGSSRVLASLRKEDLLVLFGTALNVFRTSLIYSVN